MANEESFQLLYEENTSDLSANRKRKGKVAIENARTGKSRRWCDAEVDRLIESNMLHSFGHLVQHCATSSNNVGFNNVG